MSTTTASTTPATPTDDAMYAAFAGLAATRAAAEYELVAAVVSAHPAGFPLADQAGVRPGHFDHDDLRLVYCAADVMRAADKLAVLLLARRALLADGYWNPAGPFGNTSQWSDETLVALATTGFGPASIPEAAARLLDVCRRQERAADLYAAAAAVLAGEDERAATARPVPTLPTRIFMGTPSRRRRAKGTA